MIIYCISDIHGWFQEFERALSLIDLTQPQTKLLLLGDYIHGGYDNFGVLRKITNLQEKYGRDKVTALKGNHELMAFMGWAIYDDDPKSYGYGSKYDEEYCYKWMLRLPRYYVYDNIIFVHAGINENLSIQSWSIMTAPDTFTCKYPPEVGKFGDYKIVAGHVYTSEISGNPNFNDIYYDGESHFYIDGNVIETGVIPILKINTETGEFLGVNESGEYPVVPYKDL